eukprot:gnl/Hemi2/23543_TR7898_c0_g1_i1.p1 gnl/Hemi2/23543_TR7898_c0_g1~~gnl/Hemi2/23543_TR7898_c0_g1_i1.p1  ORF type:complete len:252 (-),score=106.90 gnl/Hemi2/23543_TR7898_c0_g1_i1:93-848(-)
MSMLTSENTLVRYETSVLVGSAKDKKNRAKGAAAAGGRSQLPPMGGGGGESKTSTTEDILNAILPPREYVEEGQTWVQCVSPVIATRLDVLKLQEKLDQRLKQRQARETGICPIREELYSQCFDELIRQVTIQCAERGQLMHRVREEIRMTINAYRTLYESSIAFGMRKALQAEQGKHELEEKIETLEKENAALEKKLVENQNKCDSIQKKEEELKAAAEKRHNEEINHYKRQNNMLKNQLEQYYQSRGQP